MNLDAAAEPMIHPQAAYVHVPFCRHRCGYCDFTLIAGRNELAGRYLSALAVELRWHQSDQQAGRSPLTTLFFGGGTPTQLAPAEWRQLLSSLAARFHWDSATEISVEANPLDLLDADKRAALAETGVNRISLGVQAFDTAVLRLLERDHEPADAIAAISHARSLTPNVSVDLIFGVPGQSLADWHQQLTRVIDLGVPHVSTYGLTIEPGTAFFTRQHRGEFQPTPEALERDQYAQAMEQLTAAGYRHYELSNFAQPGWECRHNQVYWRGEEYWAYGPGAARYVAGTRATNVRTVRGWLARLERGLSPIGEEETLTPEARARERIFLGLRTAAGISRTEFRRQTGLDLDQLAGAVIAEQTAAGQLLDDGDAIRLSPAGKFLANRVVAAFL